MTVRVALTGDSIINREVSFVENSEFLDVVESLRDAEFSLTHLEALFHDFDGPEVYPSAVAPRTYTRAPRAVAGDLQWCGFDAVTHASNHALDYSYGGLRETWKELDRVGLPYAGTGRSLATAREPTYVDIADARIGIVSMTSTFPAWSRAGATRGDVPGRPGVNPLRCRYEVGPDLFESIRDVGVALGIGVNKSGEDTISLNWDSSHYSRIQFTRTEMEGAKRVLDPRDRKGNIRSIEDAAVAADIVIAHIHTHDFRLGERITEPPEFIEQFSRECSQAGADIVLNQGTHSPSRGIEIHNGTPIFYDPGDFFLMTDTVYNQPAEFYYSHEETLEDHPLEALPGNAPGQGSYLPWEDRGIQPENERLSPKGGTFTAPGSALVSCDFDDRMDLESIEIQPVTWNSTPKSVSGTPKFAEGERANEILTHIRNCSSDYDTSIEISGETGVISP